MKTYPVSPQPFGEDAVRKEARFIVASARARGDRVFKISHGDCPPSLRLLLRQTLSVLKRERKLTLFIPGEKIQPEAPAVIYLSEKFPGLFSDPELDGEHDNVTLVAL